MTLIRNSGQSSVAVGTALSAGNGALPDAPTVITPGTGGAITFETSTAPGTKEIRVTPAAGTAGYWGYTGLSGAGNSWAFRGIWHSPSTLPSSFQPIISFRSGGGGTGIATLAIDPVNKFQIIADVAGTSNISAVAIAANTVYDIECRGENGTTSTGVMTLVTRNLSNVVDTNLGVAHGGALGAGTANFGTTAFGGIRFGKAAAAGNLGATGWKYVTVQTGSSAALPQPGVNLPPTVPAITNKIQTTGSTLFTAVPVDPDGTIVGHAWVGTKPDGSSLGGLTGATTATVTVPNQTTPTGAYKLAYTATDDFGDTASTTTYDHVRAASGVGARPYLLISNAGGWTPGGAATGVVDGLAGDATKWIISQDGPAAASVVVGMAVPALGHYDVAFYLDWVATDGVTGVAGVTGPITCQVFQGTTPVTSQAIFTRTITGAVLCQVSFASAEDTALSADMVDIRIELTASQT